MPTLQAKRAPQSKPRKAARPTVVVTAKAVPARPVARPVEYDFHVVMRALRREGTAQNRKLFPRQGATGEIFGVSPAAIKDLASKVQMNHEVAEELWFSGNFDAQMLGALLADPRALDDDALDRWARLVKCAPASGAFGAAAARSAAALTRFTEWATSREEYTLTVAYDTLSAMMRGGVSVDDALLYSVIDRIEGQVHSAPNQARVSMIEALIAVGDCCPHLRAAALAAARRIGPVRTLNGTAAPATPDAIAAIGKLVAHAIRRKPSRAVASAPARTSRPTGPARAKPRAKRPAARTARRRASARRP
ncbi:MAG: DNA alkylation repair protein [Phycisphaerales bacterium]